MRCSNCGKETPFSGKVCNWCGNDKSKDQKTHSIAFIVVIILFFLVWKCSCSKTEEEKSIINEQDLKTKAFIYSQDCVEQQLKSPSTAEFPYDSEEFVTKIDEDTFIINSYVDSQNSFGAMIRTNYICQITLNDNDTYTCDSIELLE